MPVAQAFWPDTPLRTHAGVALVSLALAGLAYCAPNLLDQRRAPLLFEGRPQAVRAVHYRAAGGQTQLVCDGGHVAEVRVSSGDAEDGAPLWARYRPSRHADALLARLAPLTCLRALGPQDDAHLQLFGLAEPHAPHLRIEGSMAAVDVTLGRALYGSGDVYAQAQPLGVVVVAGALLREFEHGSAGLWDARVLAPHPLPYSKVVARRGKQRCSFVRATDDGAGSWLPVAPADAMGAPSEGAAVGQLVEQLQGLTFVAAAGPEQRAPSSQAPALALELYDAPQTDAPQDTLRLYRGPSAWVLTGGYPLEPVILSEAAAAALDDAVQHLCGPP